MARIAAGNPAAARHRARLLRWRIRLYLRPGPGYANILELALRWSRPRAVHTGHTRYMIGTGREEAPIAPLFRAFAEYVHDGAADVGSLQQHARLGPPMLMALDEVTQICPVPLPLWMADSAGKGILLVAVCHGLAQLEARWQGSGARAIWDTAGIKVILGGVSDPDTLERLSRLSRLCGEVRIRAHTRTRDDWGRRARTVTHQPVRVLPPELLRTLPDWRALVLRTNLSPVVVRLRMAWRRRDYRHARRAATALRRPAGVPAAIPPEPTGPRVAGEPATPPVNRRNGYPGEPAAGPAAPGEPAARRNAHWSRPRPDGPARLA